MNGNEIIVTSVENLRKIVFEETDKLLKKYYKPVEAKDEEVYLSREQLHKKLGINPTTEWNWRKKGLITGYSINGRIWFKLSEIEANMVKLK